MINVRRLWDRLALTSRSALIAATAVCLTLIYLWRLDSITTGLGPREVAALADSQNLSQLTNDPLFLPHKAFTYLLIHFDHASVLALRAISVAFGLIVVYSLYKIMKSWFGSMIAFLTMLIFAATPLVLLAARSADPTITYLLPLAAAGAYFWATRNPAKSRTPVIILTLAGLACLYIPGGIWLIVIGVAAARRILFGLYTSLPRWLTVVLVFSALVFVAPLFYGLYLDPSLIKSLLLIPADLPTPVEALKSVGWAALSLFWHSNTHHDLQIGRLPVLNITQLILALFGIFAMYSRARSKCIWLVSLIVLGVVISGLNDDVGFLLIPVAAITVLMAAGLRYLHLEWSSIFPLNPLPKAFALIVMSAVIGIQFAYGVRYALVAWPHTVATRNTYVLK